MSTTASRTSRTPRDPHAPLAGTALKDLRLTPTTVGPLVAFSLVWLMPTLFTSLIVMILLYAPERLRSQPRAVIDAVCRIGIKWFHEVQHEAQ